jgi:hypothetical protein
VSDLGITYASVQALVRDFLNEPAKNVDEAIKSGYRMALGACRAPGQKGRHKWSFLSPLSTLTVWPSVAVNSAVKVAGVYTAGLGTSVLTATAPSFYPSMVGHEIVVTDIGTFTIKTYTSATVVVVLGDATTTTDRTFSVASNARFSLPTDFASLASDFTFEPGTLYTRIETVTSGELQRLHEALLYVTEPAKVTIMPRAASAVHDPDEQTLYEAWFWPTPSVLRTLTYRYNLRSEMPSAMVGFVGPEDFHALIQLACFACAEVFWRGGPGSWMKMYLEGLDQQMTEDQGALPRNLGYNRDTSDRTHGPVEHYRLNDVTNVGYR